MQVTLNSDPVRTASGTSTAWRQAAVKATIDRYSRRVVRGEAMVIEQ